MKQGSTLYYLHTDLLGSSSVTSDAGGTNVGTQVYFPFGTPRASTGNLQTDFTFTGQKIDASDGLMYYGARYYDAALGRFISADTIVPDPKRPEGLNRYAYVFNNPLRFSDPSGHCPKPSANSGDVICVESFIPVGFSAIEPTGTIGFKGDRRSFSADSDPTQDASEGGSRFYVLISVNEGPTYGTKIEEGYHNTELVIGDKAVAYNRPVRSNKIEVTVLDGELIKIEYSIRCSIGCDLADIGPNGTIHLDPAGNNSYSSTGDVKPFPNLAGYKYHNGELMQMLFEWQNFSPQEINSGKGKFSTGMNQGEFGGYLRWGRDNNGYYYIKWDWEGNYTSGSRCTSAANGIGGGCREN